MRIFVAGATGVLGSKLVEKLLQRGHSVVGTSNTRTKLENLRALGVEAVQMDGLDRTSVFQAIAASRPDVIVNEMTSLSTVRTYKNFDDEFRITNRLRQEGSAHLLAAAQAHDVKRIVVQSFAGWPWKVSDRRANSEEAPFEPDVPAKMKESQAAIQQMEAMIASSQNPIGVVLRYGHLYGAGTSFAPDGGVVRAIRKKAFPLIAEGAAVWSFVHVDDAAEATRSAIEEAAAGIYNIADDQPARVAEWLPEVARILGAKPPMRVPAWLGKLFVGDSGLYLMNRARGADNLKAKAYLQWKPAFPDWRTGFANTLR